MTTPPDATPCQLRLIPQNDLRATYAGKPPVPNLGTLDMIARNSPQPAQELFTQAMTLQIAARNMRSFDMIRRDIGRIAKCSVDNASTHSRNKWAPRQSFEQLVLETDPPHNHLYADTSARSHWRKPHGLKKSSHIYQRLHALDQNMQLLEETGLTIPTLRYLDLSQYHIRDQAELDRLTTYFNTEFTGQDKVDFLAMRAALQARLQLTHLVQQIPSVPPPLNQSGATFINDFTRARQQTQNRPAGIEPEDLKDLFVELQAAGEEFDQKKR